MRAVSLNPVPNATKVAPAAPQRNGKSAEVVIGGFGHNSREVFGFDWDAEAREAASRLYRLAFDGRTGEEMDARASAWLGISADQARRIRLKQSGTRVPVFLALLAAAHQAGVPFDDGIRIVWGRIAKALTEHEEAMRGRK